LSQSNQQWHLYIHDDGSTDATRDILKGYAMKYPDQITLLDYPPQGGALPNFMSLLEKTEADYYMFSDQDDVWHPTKIEKSYLAMKEQEACHPGKPVIVHTDVRVVDGDLRLLHPSYREYGHIYPEKVTNFKQCVINITLGCAMIFNREARKVSLDRPWRQALMHDGWVTTRTFAAGGIVYALPEALLDYRNHGDNTVGATDGSRFTLRYRLTHFRQMLQLNMKQYRMLRSAGYGSIFTYYYYKFRLHIH
jgi:rhamnosyltransferase